MRARRAGSGVGEMPFHSSTTVLAAPPLVRKHLRTRISPPPPSGPPRVRGSSHPPEVYWPVPAPAAFSSGWCRLPPACRDQVGTRSGTPPEGSRLGPGTGKPQAVPAGRGCLPGLSSQRVTLVWPPPPPASPAPVRLLTC